MTKEKSSTKKYAGFVRPMLASLPSPDENKRNLSKDASELIEELIRIALDRLSFVLNTLPDLLPHATVNERDVIAAVQLIFDQENSGPVLSHIQTAIEKFNEARKNRVEGTSQNRRVIAGIRIPIARPAKYVHDSCVFVRMREIARIAIAAYLDYVVESVLVNSSTFCKKTRITIVHVNKGINSNGFLRTLYSGSIVAGGGPYLQVSNAKPKKTKAGKAKASKAPKATTENPGQTKAPKSAKAKASKPKAAKSKAAKPKATPKAAKTKEVEAPVEIAPVEVVLEAPVELAASESPAQPITPPPSEASQPEAVEAKPVAKAAPKAKAKAKAKAKK